MPTTKAVRVAVAQRVQGAQDWSVQWVEPDFSQAPSVFVAFEGATPLGPYRWEYRLTLTFLTDPVDREHAQDVLSEKLDPDGPVFQAFADPDIDDDLGRMSKDFAITAIGEFQEIKLNEANYYFMQVRLSVKA